MEKNKFSLTKGNNWDFKAEEQNRTCVFLKYLPNIEKILKKKNWNHSRVNLFSKPFKFIGLVNQLDAKTDITTIAGECETHIF